VTKALWLNNNGNVAPYTRLPTYTPDPLVGNRVPIIAPFWADVDTRGGNPVTTGSRPRERPAGVVCQLDPGRLRRRQRAAPGIAIAFSSASSTPWQPHRRALRTTPHSSPTDVPNEPWYEPGTPGRGSIQWEAGHRQWWRRRVWPSQGPALVSAGPTATRPRLSCQGAAYVARCWTRPQYAADESPRSTPLERAQAGRSNILQGSHSWPVVSPRVHPGDNMGIGVVTTFPPAPPAPPPSPRLLLRCLQALHHPRPTVATSRRTRRGRAHAPRLRRARRLVLIRHRLRPPRHRLTAMAPAISLSSPPPPAPPAPEYSYPRSPRSIACDDAVHRFRAQPLGLLETAYPDDGALPYWAAAPVFIDVYSYVMSGPAKRAPLVGLAGLPLFQLNGDNTHVSSDTSEVGT
jgi:hypothetical protein